MSASLAGGLKGAGDVLELSLWPCLLPGGLASEKDYPFQGAVRTKCQAKKHKKVAWIQDFIMLSDNEQSEGRVETQADVGGGRRDDRDRQTRTEADRWGYRQRWRNGGGRERDGDNHELRAGGTEKVWPDGTSTPRNCPVPGH